MVTIKSFSRGKTAEGIEFLSLEMELAYAEEKNGELCEIRMSSYLIITPTTVEYHLPDDQAT